MVNYQNTKIYKIESHNGPNIYIGSTTKEYLSQRMDNHRGNYKLWKKGTRGKTMSFEIFDEYGVDNCFITLIESYPCNSKDEAHSREAHYIKSMDCVNKYVPMRSHKEYYEENKVAIIERHTKRYEANKEHIKEVRKVYLEKNKEKIAERSKKYNEANKEALNARRRERDTLKKEQASSSN